MRFKKVIGLMVIGFIASKSMVYAVPSASKTAVKKPTKPIKQITSTIKPTKMMSKTVAIPTKKKAAPKAAPKATPKPAAKVLTKAEVVKGIKVNFDNLKKINYLLPPGGFSAAQDQLNQYLSNATTAMQTHNTDQNGLKEIAYKMALEYVNKAWNIDYHKGKDYYLKSVDGIIDAGRLHFLNVELDNEIQNKVIMESAFITNKDMQFFEGGFGLRGLLVIKFNSANKGFFDYMFDGQALKLNQWYGVPMDVVVTDDVADPNRHLKCVDAVIINSTIVPIGGSLK